MGLDEIRDKARASIHGFFALPAVVRSPDGLVEVAVQVRLHRNSRKPFGDLGSDGFALMIEQHNEAIFDTSEWIPVRNYTIDFGRDRVFRIDSPQSARGERYVKAWLVEEEGTP